MKNHIMTFIGWIAKSFSDKGDVSSRRLTAFAITNVYLFARVYYILRVSEPYWLFMGFVVDAIFILLLFGIVSAQQVIELKNGTVIRESVKSEKKTETITEDKTTVS